jgi:hypothetical protein
MRTREILIVALFGAASCCAALGQQSAATPKIPSGLNFAFDAQHGQITASGYALKPASSAAASTSVSGTVEVTLTINLVTKFKKDSTFPCAAIIIGGQIDTDNYILDGGVETASGMAIVNEKNPSTATCKLAIPYSWNLQHDSGASSGMLVAFAAAGVNRWGTTVRSTLQITGIESLPASGSTTTYAFNATL